MSWTPLWRSPSRSSRVRRTWVIFIPALPIFLFQTSTKSDWPMAGQPANPACPWGSCKPSTPIPADCPELTIRTSYPACIQLLI